MRFGAIFTAWGNSLQGFMTALSCYIFPVFLLLCFFRHLAGILHQMPLWVTAALHQSLFIKSMAGRVRLMACQAFQISSLRRQKTAGNAIHGKKTCNLCEDTYNWLSLLGFWQDHVLTIKEHNGGNYLFSLELAWSCKAHPSLHHPSIFSCLFRWNHSGSRLSRLVQAYLSWTMLSISSCGAFPLALQAAHVNPRFCFRHYPELMNIGEGRNVDWLSSRQLHTWLQTTPMPAQIRRFDEVNRTTTLSVPWDPVHQHHKQGGKVKTLAESNTALTLIIKEADGS